MRALAISGADSGSAQHGAIRDLCAAPLLIPVLVSGADSRSAQHGAIRDLCATPDILNTLPPNTPIYGRGFNKICQSPKTCCPIESAPEKQMQNRQNTSFASTLSHCLSEVYVKVSCRSLLLIKMHLHFQKSQWQIPCWNTDTPNFSYFQSGIEQQLSAFRRIKGFCI